MYCMPVQCPTYHSFLPDLRLTPVLPCFLDIPLSFPCLWSECCLWCSTHHTAWWCSPPDCGSKLWQSSPLQTQPGTLGRRWRYTCGQTEEADWLMVSRSPIRPQYVTLCNGPPAQWTLDLGGHRCMSSGGQLSVKG